MPIAHVFRAKRRSLSPYFNLPLLQPVLLTSRMPGFQRGQKIEDYRQAKKYFCTFAELYAAKHNRLVKGGQRPTALFLRSLMSPAQWDDYHALERAMVKFWRYVDRFYLRTVHGSEALTSKLYAMAALRQKSVGLKGVRTQSGCSVPFDVTVESRNRREFVYHPCGKLNQILGRDGLYFQFEGFKYLVTIPHKVQDLAAERARQAELRDKGVIDQKRYAINMRELRDIEQRRCAQKREKEVYKSKAKNEREKLVREARHDAFCQRYQLEGGRHVAFGVAASCVFMQITKFFRKGNRVMDKADGILTFLQDLVNSARRAFSGVKSTLWVVPIIVALYFVVKRFEIPMVARLAVCVALPKLVPKLYTGVVSNFFGGDVELQSGCDNLSKLLAATFAVATLGKGARARDVTEFMKRVTMFDRFSTNFSSMVQWFMGCVDKFVAYITEKARGKPFHILKKELDPLAEWQKEIDNCDAQVVLCSRTDGVVGAPDIVDLVNTMVCLYARGRDYKEIYRGNHHVVRFIEHGMLRLKEMIRPYQGSLNARNNFRVEPECMLLTGAPGIGKTLMTSHIAVAVLHLSGLVSGDTLDDYMQHVWQKTQSSYWNGYTGQHAVIMDDMLQFRGDPTDIENEYMTLIRTVSSWACPLEFADVDSKGKNYFVSKFILGTCNTQSFASSAKLFVHEPEAVARRIHHQYKVELNHEFMTEQRRLDIVKYQQALVACKGKVGLDAYPWYVWVARRHNFITGETSDEVISLKDIVSVVALSLKSKLESHGDAREHMVGFIKGLSAADIELQGPFGLGAKKVPGIALPASLDFDGLFEEEGDTPYNFQAMLKAHLKDICRFKAFYKAILAAGGCFILYKTIRFVLDLSWTMLSNLFSLGKGAMVKEAVSVQSNVPAVPKRRGNSVALQAGDTVIVDKAYANTYKMYLHLSESFMVVGQVMFVNDKLALQPQHFTEMVRDLVDQGQLSLDGRITFQHCMQDKFSFELTPRIYLAYSRDSYPDLDIEFLRFEDVRAHSKIENYFLTEKQVKHYVAGNATARMDMCQIDSNGALHEPRRNVVHLTRLSYSEKGFTIGSHRKLNRYFSYGASTDVGYCGAPISLVDNRNFSGHTVFGIHVAGSRERHLGFCAVVTKEMVVAAREKLNTVDDCFHEDLVTRVDYQSGNELPFDDPGSFLPIGRLTRPITICPVSSYFKTDLHGVFGPYDYAPAHLGRVFKDGEIVYPMVRAVKPYSSPVYIFDRDGFDQISHVAFSRLSALCSSVNNRIFSFDEAVLGISEMKFRSIPRNTSPGFPYCYENDSGKTAYFGDGEIYDLSNDKCKELRARVEHIVNMARQGKRTAVLFNDFLKDELRSSKKREAVATRLISSAPLDYVIAWRMYFGDFSARFMAKNVITGMAPGICAYTDWTTLSHFLTQKGEKVFAGDFKSFDSSQQASIMEVLLAYINAWYDDGEDNKRVRTVLWQDLLHSRHVGGIGNDQSYIYQWNKSLPSGHPFTTILNSMYSLFCIVACYIKATGDWTHFWDRAHAVTYGDDNVVNIQDTIAGVFNQKIVAAFMWDLFRMVYTSDDKDGDLIEYTDIKGVTFLKRSFRYDRGTVVCPLELDSFLYTIYWGKNKRLKNKIICDELETALEELSMHDDHVWNEWASRVYELLGDYLNRHSLGVPKAPCDKKSYLRIVLSRSDNWY